jgi:hypothetical protein
VNVVVREGGRLPGGLSAWPALRHGVRLRAGYVVLFLLLAAYPVAAAVAHGPWIGEFAPLFAGLFVGLSVVLERPGARVARTTQPRLAEVVASVARATGRRAPDRVWLTGQPDIAATTSLGRRDLHIGLPLLACLGEPELRALIAHELSTLDHPYPGLVRRLLSRWHDAIADDDAPSASKRRRRERVRADLGRFAAEVHRRADADAARAGATHETAARAFVLAGLVTVEYHLYVQDVDISTRSQRSPLTWRRIRAITDLDAGWRRVVARGIDCSFWMDVDLMDHSRRHPDLADAIARTRAATVRLSQPANPVPVLPLRRRDERRQAREALFILSRDSVRWHTFADAPASVWVDRAAAETDDVRRAVATVLDRPPTDHLELVEVMLNRPDDVGPLLIRLAGLADDDDEPEDDGTAGSSQDDGTAGSSQDDGDRPTGPPPLVACVVEDALLAQGWRLEHPAVRGVLVGPGGDRVDALAEVTYVDGGPVDLGALPRLLRGS